MKKPYVQERGATTTPDEVVLALVYQIRDQFYRDEQKQLFYGQLKDLKRLVTWPAAWMHGKAIFVSPARYQQIMLGVFQDIKRNGATGAIEYWPRYLLTCVQRHFRFNAEQYVDEGKAARDVVGRIVGRLPAPTTAAPDHFTRALAAAHTVLKSPGKHSKRGANAPSQQSLF